MEKETILKQALEVLRSGGVILYPTDTVWGIGCDATDPDAVARVFEIKHRADSKALVLLASDLDMVARYVKVIPQMAIDLVEVNDSPMTLVYPGAIAGEKDAAADRRRLAWNVIAEDGSVGIRIPMSEFCRQLSYKLGRPLVSTSANISGEPTPQRFTDIAEEIKSAVDYACPPKTDTESTGKASQIIFIGLDGEVKIIRA